jgi:hypothetical protein
MSSIVVDQHQILDVELDTDKLVDIVQHGMSGGVSGFIYRNELIESFNLFEDEINTYLNSQCDAYYGKSWIQHLINDGTNSDYDCINDLKQDAVWLYVEFKAFDILTDIEHPAVV